MPNFKTELEAVLDQYFPKVEEEGPEKQAMKRSAALVLYASAVSLHHQSLVKIKTDLLTIATAGGDENLRREVEQYFNSHHGN